ncbi:MAG: hypothetical protein SCK70_10990, partial [bacterium]|nr:hypothetical protein [bacterium]
MIEEVSTTARLKAVLWAIILCTIWVLFYALVMYLQIGAIPFWAALIASANYNYLFGFISIFIWFLCKKVPFDQTKKIIFFSFHFLAAIFCSALWLFISYGLW